MARRPEAHDARALPRGTANETLPHKLLSARSLVLAPHMDDEALACGGTMLLHARKSELHCLFASDGTGSPAPLLPWRGKVDADLAQRRRDEAFAAAAAMGIPSSNLHFLDLPDGRLSRCRPALEAGLAQAIARLQPEFVYAPFRYDVHPDHVALNRAARNVIRAQPDPPVLLEYFVYHRLRFLPGGDVRHALGEEALLSVDTRPVAAAKRAALDCYRSQTRLLHDWQDRPILSEENLRQRCAEPEYFLPTDPTAPLSEGFARHRQRVRLACLAMRFAKRPKDRAVAFVHWVLGR